MPIAMMKETIKGLEIGEMLMVEADEPAAEKESPRRADRGGPRDRDLQEG
jgi:TusA-related sulfurtransferase